MGTFTVVTERHWIAFAGKHREKPAGVPHSARVSHRSRFGGPRTPGWRHKRQLFAAIGDCPRRQEGRQDWVLRGFRQFDAPVCIIITYDRELADSDDTPFDCGAVTTALVNAAWSRGLGAVINSQGIMQSPVVREHANIPEGQVIMKAVAMGWPDDSFGANAVVSSARASMKPLSSGFDDQADHSQHLPEQHTVSTPTNPNPARPRTGATQTTSWLCCLSSSC